MAKISLRQLCYEANDNTDFFIAKVAEELVGSAVV